MTIDIERIGEMVEDVDRYFGDLESFGIENDESFKNLKTCYAASMVMFQIVNRTIDLGEEILRSRRFGMPKSYANIFEMLRDRKIIDDNLAETMIFLAKSRNVLAHEYQKIESRDIFNVYQKIYKVNDFIETVKEIVKENE